MSLINNVNEVLHRIKVKLYPNYLPHIEGTYYARTNNEALLSIEQVCAALKTRGGFSGNYETLVENVKLFFDEAAYQLCDGFAVNTGYYSIHPNICGTFTTTIGESHDHKKNPIAFRFRTRAKLRKLADSINIEITGVANTSGYIKHFNDLEEDAEDSIFVPGNQFSITGQKIKVFGDDPACGVYFVPVEDPSKAVKVARIAENSPSKIIGISVKTGFSLNKVEVRTQFAGSGTSFLKNPRTITSDFIIEEA